MGNKQSSFSFDLIIFSITNTQREYKKDNLPLQLLKIKKNIQNSFLYLKLNISSFSCFIIVDRLSFFLTLDSILIVLFLKIKEFYIACNL